MDGRLSECRGERPHPGEAAVEGCRRGRVTPCELGTDRMDRVRIEVSGGEVQIDRHESCGPRPSGEVHGMPGRDGGELATNTGELGPIRNAHTPGGDAATRVGNRQQALGCGGSEYDDRLSEMDDQLVSS